jgi:hypothetical protein
MPEFSEDGGLLQALRDEPIPPSTLDIGDLVAGGRRKVQTRNWIGAAAITAVLVAAIPVALVNARSPNALPDQQPLATPTAAAIAPTACALELLPADEGYPAAEVTGGDTSGRYLTGHASREGGTAPVIWDNGVVMPLSFPAGTLMTVVNHFGVIAGYSLKEAWVYRDGKFTILPQPVAGVTYRPAGINNNGQILGSGPEVVNGKITSYPPMIWAPDNSVQAIAERSFRARGIDDDGTVIGQENLRQYPGDMHGLIWSPGKAVTDLPMPGGVKAGGTSIRDGWVAGLIAYSGPSDLPLKPFIYHLGTGRSVEVPSDVVNVEDVSPLGWAVVNTLSAGPSLLADGKLLPLPKPAGLGPEATVYVRTISDDGRTLGGYIGYSNGSQPAVAVRWLCK